MFNFVIVSGLFIVFTNHPPIQRKDRKNMSIHVHIRRMFNGIGRKRPQYSTFTTDNGQNMTSQADLSNFAIPSTQTLNKLDLQ
jgi:hypothetical protein